MTRHSFRDFQCRERKALAQGTLPGRESSSAVHCLCASVREHIGVAMSGDRRGRTDVCVCLCVCVCVCLCDGGIREEEEEEEEQPADAVQELRHAQAVGRFAAPRRTNNELPKAHLRPAPFLPPTLQPCPISLPLLPVNVAPSFAETMSPRPSPCP